MAGKKSLLINCAARNSVRSYPRLTPSKFADAPTIFEASRSHEMPDVIALPGGADLSVEFYGGAYSPGCGFFTITRQNEPLTSLPLPKIF